MKVSHELTPQQREQVDRIEDILKGAATVEIHRLAELLASEENGNSSDRWSSSSVTSCWGWANGHLMPLLMGGKGLKVRA